MIENLSSIMFWIVIATTFGIMIKEKKLVPKSEVSQNPLTKNQKILIGVLCVFNPIIAGAILFYGWKKRLPTKAAQANKISWVAFFALVLIAVLLFVINI